MSPRTLLLGLASGLTAMLPFTGTAQQFEFNVEDSLIVFYLEDSLAIEKTEIAYALDVGLDAQTSTRIAVDAVLDLQDLQDQLPALMENRILLDLCGNKMTLTTLEAKADGAELDLSGGLEAHFFVCEKLGGGSFQRGESREKIGLDFQAEASVELSENCLYLRLEDLKLDPKGDLETIAADNENLEAARVLLVEAIRLILDDEPLCPRLPPQLSALDPSYDEGGSREVGDGGLGAYLRGSVDVGPQSILQILTVLQNNGIVPGRP